MADAENSVTPRRRAPVKPNKSRSAASSISASAYWLWSRLRLAQLISSDEVAAPRMKQASAAAPAVTASNWPRARLSASEDTMPVMCDVYCETARKPPALTAPATNASVSPRWRLASLVRSFPEMKRR